MGPRSAVPPLMRIVATVAVLIVCWLFLPVRLQRSADGPSNEACLTLADHPPAESGTFLATLEQCAVLVPDDVELLSDLGAEYEKSGRAADAEAVYRRALERDPEYGDLHSRLANLLLKRGAVGDARIHAEAALKLQPNRQAVMDILSEVLRVEAGGLR